MLTGRQNAKFVCRIHGHEEDIPERLERIEEMIQSVEKRMWMTVFGMVGVMLTVGATVLLVWSRLKQPLRLLALRNHTPAFNLV